jgi:hypothetical protein
VTQFPASTTTEIVAIHNYKYASKLAMASFLANENIYFSITNAVQSFQTRMQGHKPEIITKIFSWLNLMCVYYLFENPRMAFGASSRYIIVCYNWQNSQLLLDMKNRWENWNKNNLCQKKVTYLNVIHFIQLLKHSQYPPWTKQVCVALTL